MSQSFITNLPETVAEETAPLGGYLRCETCKAAKNLEGIAAYYANGWPRCCGYTMRWWTQRQIDAGEVPDA